MVFAVAYHVVVHADKCAYYAEIRLEARAEGDGAILAEELRYLRLQLHVKIERSIQEARPGATGAVLLDSLKACLDNLGTYRKPKVVVGTEHDTPTAFHDDLDILPRFKHPEIRVYSGRLDFVGTCKFKALLEYVHDVLPNILSKRNSLRNSPCQPVSPLQQISFCHGRWARYILSSGRNDVSDCGTIFSSSERNESVTPSRYASPRSTSSIFPDG